MLAKTKTLSSKMKSMCFNLRLNPISCELLNMFLTIKRADFFFVRKAEKMILKKQDGNGRVCLEFQLNVNQICYKQ